MSEDAVNTSGEQAQPALAPADVTTKIESPADTPDTVEAEVKPKGEAPLETEGGPEEQRKRPTGSERLKRQLARAQATADELARELEDTRRRTSDGANPQGKPGKDRPPTEADFPNDYLAFEAAKSEWTTRAAVREELGKAEAARRNTQRREVIIERSETYEEYAGQVRERIPDFDKTLAEARNTNFNASNELIEEIMASDKAPLLQYHLAKNLDKLRELNELSGRDLAREMGKLEARVHLPTPKKATEAAPPPSQVRGTAAQAIDPRVGPDDMNEYAKWREKQRAKAS